MGGWPKGKSRGPSPLRGEYRCPNGCGRIIDMPGAIQRHLRTCVTSIEQLRDIGGCNDKSDEECWLWSGLAEGERRRISFRSPVTGSDRRRYVYVIAFILATGKDPETDSDKPLICHTCDDGRCFNPAHLFNGSQQENLRDMTLKGRGRPGFRAMDPDRLREVCSKAGTIGASRRWGNDIETSKEK